MSAPETEADKLPDDAPSIVAQKALMKAIWHCIVDASSMNVVMSGGEVNKATRNLRAAIEAEARQSALTEAIRRVEGLPWRRMTGQGLDEGGTTGDLSWDWDEWEDVLDKSAVLAILRDLASRDTGATTGGEGS